MFDMYVLVICDLKSSFLIASNIKSIDERFYSLYGVYNLLVKIYAPSYKDLEYAYHKIRHMEGIGSTLSLIAKLQGKSYHILERLNNILMDEILQYRS
jgi:DNA-binding Lrp family transcriptional regulator